MDKRLAFRAMSRNNKKADPPPSWWFRQAKERPLATIGTIASAVGGLILLAFFSQLGGMPELDLAGASAVMMAVAIVGFVFVAALAGSGIGAGLMMREERDSPNGLSEARALFMLAGPGTISVIALAVYWCFDPKGRISAWAYGIPPGLLVLFACAFALLRPKKSRASKPDNWQQKARRGMAFLLYGCVWLYSAATAFLTLYAFFPRDGASWQFLIGFVAWTIWCYLSNVLIALVGKVHVLTAMSICAAVSLSVLLLATGNWFGIPRGIVSVLGLGEIPVRMVVTHAGCDYLNKAANDRAVCRIEPGESTAVVCPAMLRSRIGSPFFIGLSAYDDDGRWPQLHPPKRLEAIAIPKADVPSWAQLTRAAAKVPRSAASGAIVTYLAAEDRGAWLREQCGESTSAAPHP